MSDEFKIEVNNWLPSTVGDPEVRETIADVSIKVKSYFATEVEDRPAQSVRKSIRVSAYLLASWLASNWWRLRWEPEKKPLTQGSQSLDWDLSHEVASSGGGYVWPPVTLSSDGYHVLVRCEGQGKSADESLSPVRYLNSFGEFIDVSSFETGISHFVEQVLSRLDARGLQNSPLHELWSEIRTERAEKPLGSKRRLEALLGVDPDEAESLIKGLLQWQQKVGEQALEEIAAASSTFGVEDVLKATADAAKSVDTYSRISEYLKIKEQLAGKGSLANRVPWQLGKDAAETIRNVWGLGKQPVKNRDIAERLQVDEAVLSEAHPDIPVSVGVRGSRSEELKLLLKPAHPHRQRFALSRLIGDHIGINVGDTWKPATHSMTARQKFQRAFAAEFLCPSDELYERFSNDRLDLDDVEETSLEVAKEYEVSQKLVLNHLVNRGVIDASVWGVSEVQPASYSFGY
ncbi:MAG TPA: hypothetical protein VGI45_29080 [Terracidiphilus sp.]|jgi:hypothetical protein